MYMDDIKLFAKNEKVLETLIQAVRIYSQDIGMEFGIEKYAVLIMRDGKQQMMEKTELPNQEKIKMLREKETYKYLGILEVDTVKQVELKEKKFKKYLRKTRKLLKIKLYSRKLIQESKSHKDGIKLVTEWQL